MTHDNTQNPPNSYWFMLGGWANQMAMRFGHAVYLTGSALHKARPRDVDVRIVLPDEDFAARYGRVSEWEEAIWLRDLRPAGQKVFSDAAKLGREAALKCRVNIDLQIQPLSFALRHYRDQPRLRLDTVDGAQDEFGGAAHAHPLAQAPETPAPGGDPETGDGSQSDAGSGEDCNTDG